MVLAQGLSQGFSQAVCQAAVPEHRTGLRDMLHSTLMWLCTVDLVSHHEPLPGASIGEKERETERERCGERQRQRVGERDREKWKLVCLFDLISDVASITSAIFYWPHRPSCPAWEAHRVTTRRQGPAGCMGADCSGGQQSLGWMNPEAGTRSDASQSAVTQLDMGPSNAGK